MSVDEEDRCMLLLCSLPNSWDHLVMAIRSTTTQLKMDVVVVALLLEEMRKRSSEVAREVLVVRNQSRDNNKKNFKEKCWNCGHTDYIQKDCKEKKKKKKV